MREHLISVIIPVYNGEKTIVRCLDSIKNQTFVNTEIIIVNDGSTDNSLISIEQYKNNNPSLNIKMITQTNSGASVARNTGINASTGDYIAFMDCDDTIEPDYLNTLYNLLLENNSDIAICGCKNIDFATEQVLFSDIPGNHSFFIGEKRIVFWGAPWGKLIKSDLIKNNKCFFSPGEKLEDDPYSLMVHSFAEKIAISDYCGYNYYVDNPSSSMGKVKRTNELADIFPFNAYEYAVSNVIEFNGDIDAIKVYEILAIGNKLFKACRHNSFRGIKKIASFFSSLDSKYKLMASTETEHFIPTKIRLKLVFMRVLSRTKLLPAIAWIITRF